jgi:hypothetical protein
LEIVPIECDEVWSAKGALLLVEVVLEMKRRMIQDWIG